MSEREHDIAIFDVDGTLFYTKPGIVAAIKDTISELGMRELKDEEYDQFIGPPINQTFARVYSLSDEQGMELARKFRSRYEKEKYLCDAYPYEGMMETLAELKERGIHIGVATYKLESMAKKICSFFGVDRFAGSIHGTDSASAIKKPEIINMCLEDFDCTDRGRAVMIGDTAFDAEGAVGIGTRFLGVSYGFGFREETEVMNYAGAIGMAKSPEEILNFF